MAPRTVVGRCHQGQSFVNPAGQQTSSSLESSGCSDTQPFDFASADALSVVQSNLLGYAPVQSGSVVGPEHEIVFGRLDTVPAGQHTSKSLASLGCSATQPAALAVACSSAVEQSNFAVVAPTQSLSVVGPLHGTPPPPWLLLSLLPQAARVQSAATTTNENPRTIRQGEDKGL